MKNNASFDVDHEKLGRGIYLSKVDSFGGIKTITLDIRLRVPYKEDILTNTQLHTYEHCFASAIRNVRDNNKEYENIEVSYFGPMGCQTGFYLVFNLDKVEEKDYAPLCAKLMKDSMAYLRGMKEVPAKNQRQCGNYLTLADMTMVKEIADDMDPLIDEMIDTKEFFKYTYI